MSVGGNFRNLEAPFCAGIIGDDLDSDRITRYLDGIACQFRAGVYANQILLAVINIEVVKAIFDLRTLIKGHIQHVRILFCIDPEIAEVIQIVMGAFQIRNAFNNISRVGNRNLAGCSCTVTIGSSSRDGCGTLGDGGDQAVCINFSHILIGRSPVDLLIGCLIRGYSCGQLIAIQGFQRNTALVQSDLVDRNVVGVGNRNSAACADAGAVGCSCFDHGSTVANSRNQTILINSSCSFIGRGPLNHLIGGIGGSNGSLQLIGIGHIQRQLCLVQRNLRDRLGYRNLAACADIANNNLDGCSTGGNSSDLTIGIHGSYGGITGLKGNGIRKVDGFNIRNQSIGLTLQD